MSEGPPVPYPELARQETGKDTLFQVVVPKFQEVFPEYRGFDQRNKEGYTFLYGESREGSNIRPVIWLRTRGDGFGLAFGDSLITQVDRRGKQGVDSKYLQKEGNIFYVAPIPRFHEDWNPPAWSAQSTYEAISYAKKLMDGVVVDDQFLHQPCSWSAIEGKARNFQELISDHTRNLFIEDERLNIPLLPETEEFIRRTYQLSIQEVQALTKARIMFRHKDDKYTLTLGNSLDLSKGQACNEVDSLSVIGQQIMRQEEIAVEAAIALLHANRAVIDPKYQN